ncbi:CSR1-phosphatidylinositol transfer [Fusarium albosuccineum]|uniref:CSR1-phosphatidylinositol transfer n=1 Tax=Fusarium albosuccineum TaxID=1237068 RepID=A0A8H4L5Q7_9HYPO|nr:CSR1-phosphatidylinositol transfer [Fusarium albosuccineum]
MRPQLRRFLCSDRSSLASSQRLLRPFPALPSAVSATSVRPPPLVKSHPTPASLRRISTATYPSGLRKTSPVSESFNYSARACTTRATSLLTAQRSYTTRPRNSTPGSTGNRPPEDSLSQFVIEAALLAFVLIATVLSTTGPANDSSFDNVEEDFDAMSTEVPPGRPGNLTPEQEEKLRKLWASIFQLTGVADDDSSGADILAAKDQEATPTDADAPKKKRFGAFRKGKSGTSTPTEAPAEEDKYGQTKHFYETLANETPESIRHTIWTMVKHDHPDALVLRFLRARKWDVEKALVMLVSTMNWRHTDMHVDDDIMKNGDAFAIEDEKAANSDTKQVSTDVMAQLRMGKSFLHGTDKNGRPICVVRVRFHKIGAECEKSLEKYTVYIIETARMVLQPPVDTACVIFDMTGFSMANMDYTPVKFMIKCFEANYPESLGAVLVHRAPWLFQGIWKVIKGWLDPVVAAKVHFTNNRAELEEFIAPDHLIKELDGDENWEYKYVEPIPGENDKMKDTETRDRLLAQREELVKKFEHATREWIRNPEGEQAAQIKTGRERLAKSLKEDYWNLDPYIRARTLYDRQGAIQAGGKTDWYSPAKPATSTSGDDVD